MSPPDRPSRAIFPQLNIKIYFTSTPCACYEGECEIPLNFAGAEQATICTYTGPGTGIDGCGYTANFILPSPVLQLVNFYDDYSFRTGTGFNNTNFPAPVGNYSCGKKTGSIVYVPGQDTRLYKAYYYSMRGNLIREVSSNLRGGYDTTETTYSFTDRPSHSTHTHTAQNAPTLTEAYDYTYDHADRLTKVEHTFGGVKQTLLAHAYDELCRLSHTDYHGSSANRLSYDYNTRGWLTAIISSPLASITDYRTTSQRWVRSSRSGCHERWLSASSPSPNNGR